MPQNLPPPRIHVLAKPSGATCNLACSYCFFLDKELLYPNSKFRMTDEVLENYIRQLIESHRTSEVTVAWQGGEPTLMGVDFYRTAIQYQEKYRKPGMTFENTMQTNGTLLDDEWCEFFKENDYLIGISIDGPQHLHDAHRVDKGSQGTYDNVMRGLRLLQKHEVEYNVLVTVNSLNADYPREIYRFMRDEVGTKWIQFIPIVERVNPDGYNVYQMGNTVTERSVRPEQFGRFLIQVFDEWIREDVGEIFVQTFEAAARNWMGLDSSGMCVFEETCGLGLAIEHNGDLYSCDHFVEPDYLLGNIKEEHMLQMVASDEQTKFGQDKRDSLPQYCLDCDVRFACHGECPKNRFIETPSGEPGLNYLCAGYKGFFHRINEPFKILTMLMRSGRPASDVMAIVADREIHFKESFAKAKVDDNCPCGSQMRFKDCHGWQRPKRRRKRRRAVLPQARPPVRIS
ncbi:MAG: anaerobic sulfatase maturase [Chloroflexota bacterium]|nr:MAG: anaerobic sulfatase maturase [Chloroflexota bacterium]